MNLNISNEYNVIKTAYEDFLNEVKRAVEKVLSKYEIPVAFEISGRLKEHDSILEKHASNRTNIIDSITELKDLVGIRVVLLFPEYKEKVATLLSEHFSLIERSVESSNHDIFGYNSIHLVLSIKPEWSEVVPWEGHHGKKIEIQIRTLSDHIWAETSHSLFYKREENIPKIIRRDLSRLSALLEVVDEKMQNIKNNVVNHFEHIKHCSYEEILEMDLNPETFNRVMVKCSDGIYENTEKRNKILSSEIESNYNIVNAGLLDDLICQANINVAGLNSMAYVDEVIKVLDSYKSLIDESQAEGI
jgi:putative GTP pyrophosphokinase